MPSFILDCWNLEYLGPNVVLVVLVISNCVLPLYVLASLGVALTEGVLTFKKYN